MANIRELMTENPATCAPDATVLDAAKMMAGKEVGPLPVVEGERLVGMVTDRDLVVRVLAEEKDPGSTAIGDIASRDLVVVSPDGDLDDALKLMARHQVRRLPVVDGDRIVGILAQADVARQAPEKETGEVVEEISR